MKGQFPIKHGHSGHCKRSKPSRTYNTWSSMKNRCVNPSKTFWNGYGITVCERWAKSFENFLEDMGERPTGRTLDRIDPNKGYCKENCRWATDAEQMHNARNNVVDWQLVRRIRHMAKEGFSHREVAEHFGLKRRNVSHIIAGRTWKEGA